MTSEWARMLHAAKLCVRCKQQDAYTLNGYWRCYECNAIHNDDCRAYRTANGESAREREKRIRDERRANGQCPRCGASVSGTGYIQCAKCRARENKNQGKRREGKSTPTALRGADGMCYLHTDRPAMKGYKICEECYQNSLKALAKGRKAQEQGRKYKVWENWK